MSQTPPQNTKSPHPIRTLRQEVGLTAGEVAERAGTTASYLSRVENRKVPANPAYLMRISNVLTTELRNRALAGGPDVGRLPS